MVFQSKRKLKVLDRTQDSTVKPLGQGQWKQHIRNLRCGPTHFTSLSSHQRQYTLSVSLSPSIIYTPCTCPPMPFSFLLSGFSRKNALTHGKDFLALGLVVRSSRGKFSGSDPDGTCGCVGSHCSLVPPPEVRAGDSLANAQSAPQKFNSHIWFYSRPQAKKLMANLSAWMLCVYIEQRLLQ